MKDDRVYLRHILDCIRRIEENVVGGRQRFKESHTLQDAVLRNLQTMAESTQRLSDASKATQPHIPWAEPLFETSSCMITSATTSMPSGILSSATYPP